MIFLFIRFRGGIPKFSCWGNGQNYCTRTGLTVLQKDWYSLYVLPLPPPKIRCCFTGIAFILSEVETEGKVQTYAILLAMQASCTHNIRLTR